MLEVEGTKLPLLTLFTNNKEEAIRNFNKLEEDKTSDVGKLLRRIIRRKYISLPEAAVLINHPQTGPITSPFRRNKGPKKDDSQQSKKPKTGESTETPKGFNDISSLILKYSPDNTICRKYLSGILNYGQLVMISSAYSHNSWNSMDSAINCYRTFSNTYSQKISVSEDSLCNFIWWCYNTRLLKYTTILSYVSSIRTISDLQGSLNKDLYSNKVKTILKGIRNLEESTNVSATKRLAFSYPLLRSLGNVILESNWSEEYIRIFWTLCCLLFFGSFRIGELLSFSENKFDSLTTLLWGDVLCLKNSVRLFIRFPKIFSHGGITVDLFEFNEGGCCPVEAIKNLRSFKKVTEQDLNKPVFMYNNGNLLTPAKFNSTLRSLLYKVIGEKADFYSSHSFRAAIPSLLSSYPNLASNSELMNWGRWNSDCYKHYTKLKLNQRYITFNKICSLLKNQVSPSEHQSVSTRASLKPW